MSSYVDREWFYYLRGRELLLYKLLGGSSSERITQSGVFKTQQNELMYPNEDIEDGLRIEYTALNEPFVAEALETTTAVASSNTINFQVAASAFYTDVTGINFSSVAPGGSNDTISGLTDAQKYFYVGQSIAVTGANTGSNNKTYTVNAVSSTHNRITVNEDIGGFESNQTITVKNNGNAILAGVSGTNTFTDFLATDKIRVQGSASNDADYTISSISSNGDALIISSASSVELAGGRITITQIPIEDATPDETSHANLNRMLSLALVDYLKAMEADKMGDIQRKEYYIKEFYGKLGDNESNKRKISMSFPSGPFAIR